MSRTHTLSPEIVDGIALVGKIVTVPLRSGQYKVHSVEGHDWYAFDKDGQTTVDLSMSPACWITSPVATVIPTDHEVGEGFSEMFDVTFLRRGVNLVKSWA